MKAHDYNLEYFKCIRDEITRRVEVHYKLVLAKIAFVGAALSFLLKTGDASTRATAFVVSSIVAFLMDVIVLENLGWIRSAASYVKQNIESVTDDAHPVIKWETHFVKPGERWACFDGWYYLFGVWSIGLLLLVVHVASRGRMVVSGSPLDVGMVAVAVYLAAFSAWSMGRNLGGKEPPTKSDQGQSPVALPS